MMKSKSNQYRIKKITYKDGRVEYVSQRKNKLKDVESMTWFLLFSGLFTLHALLWIWDDGIGWGDIETKDTQEKACAAISHFIHVDNLQYEKKRAEKLSVTKVKSEIIESCG